MFCTDYNAEAKLQRQNLKGIDFTVDGKAERRQAWLALSDSEKLQFKASVPSLSISNSPVRPLEPALEPPARDGVDLAVLSLVNPLQLPAIAEKPAGTHHPHPNGYIN